MTQSAPGPKHTETLSRLLLELLSRPPARSGMRLKSQRQLAGILGVDRHQVRGALAVLSDAGVLVQRHGSGTYLRRVPSPVGVHDTSSYRTEELLDPSGPGARRALSAEQGRLHFGVLTDLHWPSPTRRTLAEHLVLQARAMGHEAELVGLTSAPGQWLRGKALQQALPTPCDAYLVHDDAAATLLPWLERQDRPYVLFDALDLVRHQPTVLSNLDEAVERAVLLLSAEGWSSIGLLSYAGNRNLDLEQFRYQRGLRRCGARHPPRMVTTSLNPGSIARATRRLLELPVEAFYVADDTLFPTMRDALARLGRVPGRDVGIITMSSRGHEQPDSLDWSRMVFDPVQFAQRTLQALVSFLQRADNAPGNLSSLLYWEPGRTHRKPVPDSGRRSPRKRQPTIKPAKGGS